MTKKTITIAHLYPRELNIYGDIGNVITLQKRLEWRGFEPKIVAVEAGMPVDWSTIDLVFGGGGQDSGQLIAGEDLRKHASSLQDLAGDHVPMLVICGSYQLFGHSFTTVSGKIIPGINILGVTTTGSNVRMTGNLLIETQQFGSLIGFENHSGQTILDANQAPLGQVTHGHGNGPEAIFEGAIQDEVIGTYMHGPVLPKNPRLADALLLAALKRRYNVQELEPLDDGLEAIASRVAATRPQ